MNRNDTPIEELVRHIAQPVTANDRQTMMAMCAMIEPHKWSYGESGPGEPFVSHRYGPSTLAGAPTERCVDSRCQ